MIDKHIIRYFLRYKARYLIGFVTMVSASFIVMLPPIVVRKAIDAIDGGTTTGYLLQLVGLVFVLAAIEGTVRFTSRFLINGTSRRVEYEMRNDVARKLMELDQDYYLKAQTGDLMARCTNDLQRVRDLMGPATLEIGRATLLMIVGFAFILSIDVKLALIALAYFPVIAVIMVRYRSTVEGKYRAVQDQFGVLANRVQENISGIRAIKAYAQEDSETETFSKANNDLMKLTMNWALVMGAFWPMMSLAAGASVILVLWFGGKDVVNGTLTIGEFVQFNAYLSILTMAMIPLGWTATMAQQGIASMKRVAEVLDAKPGIIDPVAPQHIDQTRGEIEYRDVSFKYGERPILEDISLKIPSGATVALVGGTGVGKTTLVNLLVRLHDPDEGQVLIDGTDIRELPLLELRELVGFVPQETFLFSDTLRENIALAKPDPTDEEVEYAAQTSQLVNDLPQLTYGLQTVLGERGVTLSGGQKQRTALARALLKAPPILVLDDALSHVDTHTEEEILRRLGDFMKQRTTILIAHRTSTLATADFIVVLDQGRIAEKGTHEELLALEGVYARFYHRQLLAEQIEEAPVPVAATGGDGTASVRPEPVEGRLTDTHSAGATMLDDDRPSVHE